MYNIRAEAIEILNQQADNDLIDLYYGDESGFSEQGYYPYAWQFSDEKVAPPVTHGKQPRRRTAQLLRNTDQTK